MAQCLGLDCRPGLPGFGGIARAFARMPAVLCFAFWMSWYNYFSGDPFSAFVETMTQCPPPQPVGTSCPTGSIYSGGICVPAPRDSPEWSLSPSCADQNLVLGRVSKLNGVNAAIANGVSLFSVLFAGWYMDARGRRPVLLAFLSANVVVKAMLFASCFLRWNAFVTVIIVQNVIEVATGTTVYPALNCMVNDLSEGRDALLAEGYAALEAAKNLACLLALLSGYPVLKAHLTSYAGFWAALTAVSVLANGLFHWLLRETLAKPQGKSESCAEPAAAGAEAEAPGGATRRPRGSASRGWVCWGALTLCREDPFLPQYLLLWAMVTLACKASWDLAPMYLQAFLGAEQADASLCRCLWHLALLAGAAISAPLLRRHGGYRVHGASLAAMALAWAACGLGGALPRAASPLFWVGGVGLGGLAFGALTPCSGAIISGRTPTELQGQVFALGLVAGTAVGIPLTPLWSQTLFDPAAVGWAAGRMWLVSAALLLFALGWFLLLCCRDARACAVAGGAPPPTKDDDS